MTTSVQLLVFIQAIFAINAESPKLSNPNTSGSTQRESQATQSPFSGLNLGAQVGIQCSAYYTTLEFLSIYACWICGSEILLLFAANNNIVELLVSLWDSCSLSENWLIYSQDCSGSGRKVVRP